MKRELRVGFTLTVDPAVDEELRRLAYEGHCTKTDVVRTAVAEYIARQKEVQS